jgi:hypothetical protein
LFVNLESLEFYLISFVGKFNLYKIKFKMWEVVITNINHHKETKPILNDKTNRHKKLLSFDEKKPNGKYFSFVFLARKVELKFIILVDSYDTRNLLSN